MLREPFLIKVGLVKGHTPHDQVILIFLGNLLDVRHLAKQGPQAVDPYRDYMEQAASLEWFVGAYWFAWRDETVLGRMDGENYNIGFVDVTDRPYAELVEAAQATHKWLKDVHSGKLLPLTQHPLVPDAGAPSSPHSHCGKTRASCGLLLKGHQLRGLLCDMLGAYFEFLHQFPRCA